MLNFNHVYYFHVAATEGSVARAADRLGVTQPTVSEQIKQLERSLDTALFERTATGLRLTEDGRGVYVQTTAMFRSAERIFEAVGQTMPGQIPDLRIGISAAVSRSVATDFLLPVLMIDNCLPTIQNGEFPQLVQALRRHDLDLVLAESTPPRSGQNGLQVADVYRPRLVAITRPGKPAAEAWGSRPLIQYGVTSDYRWEVESYLAAHGLQPRIAAETDDAVLMLEAAARADCIAFVPRSLARDAIAAGRVEVLATLEPGSASVHAIYHDGESSEMVRRAVALLIEHALALEA